MGMPLGRTLRLAPWWYFPGGAGCGALGEPGLEEAAPAQGRGLELGGLEGLSNPNHSVLLWVNGFANVSPEPRSTSCFRGPCLQTDCLGGSPASYCTCVRASRGCQIHLKVSGSDQTARRLDSVQYSASNVFGCGTTDISVLLVRASGKLFSLPASWITIVAFFLRKKSAAFTAEYVMIFTTLYFIKIYVSWRLFPNLLPT